MQKMDPEMLLMVLDTLSKLEKDKLPLDIRLDLDHTANFPMDLIRFMVGPEVGLHLIFVPKNTAGSGREPEISRSFRRKWRRSTWPSRPPFSPFAWAWTLSSSAPHTLRNRSIWQRLRRRA